MSRGIAVGIATAYGLGDERLDFESRKVNNFHFSISSGPTLRSVQPPIQWVLGALYPGVKRQGREADHSPPAITKIETTYVFMTVLS
jgi:hypothetical protein